VFLAETSSLVPKRGRIKLYPHTQKPLLKGLSIIETFTYNYFLSVLKASFGFAERVIAELK
jgi:hypothetical protein